MRVSRKRTKKPFCIRGVHCRSHEQRGYSNMCRLSLGCQVSCEDCRYPSLAPVIIGWGPCLDWTWEESPVLTSQKITDFKKHYNFFFGWSPGSCTGFAVGRLSSLSSPLAWCMLWKLDFFFFSWGMWVCKWDQYCIKSKLFWVPSSIPDFSETISEMQGFWADLDTETAGRLEKTLSPYKE